MRIFYSIEDFGSYLWLFNLILTLFKVFSNWNGPFVFTKNKVLHFYHLDTLQPCWLSIQSTTSLENRITTIVNNKPFLILSLLMFRILIAKLFYNDFRILLLNRKPNDKIENKENGQFRWNVKYWTEFYAIFCFK